jgi:hypothetical protein
MPDSGSPAPILDLWSRSRTWLKRSRVFIHPGIVFALTCAFVIGRFILGYANAVGWVLLSGIPLATSGAALVLRGKSDACVAEIEKRIGAGGVATLDLREGVTELNRESGRLLELKKAFLGALERDAIHVGGSPEDVTVRIRRLKKAIADSTPPVEKLSGEVERLERAFQSALGDPETTPERWAELARTYRTAHAELEAVKTGLLH